MSKLPTFRGFVFDRLLGIGATAEVFSARNTNSNRQVALKVFSSIVSSDSELVERLQAEAEILERLRHPNVVATYGVQKYEDEFAIELELVDGVDLRKWMDVHQAKQGLIEPSLWALAQISRGLGAAHEIGVLHRDLKPENVLISKNGDVKITDFGLARTVTRVTMTRVGLLVGSLGYLAPEVVNGERATPQSDLFSLGVIGYEMLVGRPPFVGETPQSLIQKLTLGIFQPTCEAAPHIPREVGALIDSCLARDPNVRPKSVWEIEAKLMTVLSAGPLLRFSKMLLAASLQPLETDELASTALRLKREWLIENSNIENRGWFLPEFHRLFPQDAAITEIIEKSAGADSKRNRNRAVWMTAAAVALLFGVLLLNIQHFLPTAPRLEPPLVANAMPTEKSATVIVPASVEPVKKKTAHIAKTEINGTLSFEVPEDVNVYVADVLVPREELAAYKIAAGRYPMRMVKDGFLPIESMVDVKSGRVAVIRAGGSR